jgi:hypothetical protein
MSDDVSSRNKTIRAKVLIMTCPFHGAIRIAPRELLAARGRILLHAAGPYEDGILE